MSYMRKLMRKNKRHPKVPVPNVAVCAFFKALLEGIIEINLISLIIKHHSPFGIWYSESIRFCKYI